MRVPAMISRLGEIAAAVVCSDRIAIAILGPAAIALAWSFGRWMLR